jgi:uncharacterized membrane protein YfcA
MPGRSPPCWSPASARAASPPAAPGRLRGGVRSTVSGFTSTIAHAGGPPLAIYLDPLRLERAQRAATSAVVFGVVSGVRLVPDAVLGQWSATNLLTSLVLLPPAPIGVRPGVRLQGRISDRVFDRVIHLLLAATGLRLVAEGLGL